MDINEKVNKIKVFIRDSIMEKININFLYDFNYQNEDSINIDLFFVKEVNDEKIKLKLSLTDVKKFDVSYDMAYPRTYIDLLNLCFMDEKKLYYFSLDPYDENKGIDDRDNQIIIAKKIDYQFVK